MIGEAIRFLCLSALVFIAMMELYHRDKEDDGIHVLGGMFMAVLLNAATEGLIFYTATFPLRMLGRVILPIIGVNL